jgi:murein DD-endopeptidase MepM/ murein hydrolase activator NlpD
MNLNKLDFFFNFMIMKTLILFLLPLKLFAQSYRKEIRKYQNGKMQEDTSFVYWLPYKEGTKQWMVQGFLTSYSHKYLIANDFKMKMGTTICAARAGIVYDVEESSNIGGLKDKENHWNYILIIHEDSSVALYGHLKMNGALVAKGDSVTQGQAIAESGNTGYSAFPHLHFQVKDKNGVQIPVRFLTKNGRQYLRQRRFYKCLHNGKDKTK